MGYLIAMKLNELNFGAQALVLPTSIEVLFWGIKVAIRDYIHCQLCLQSAL